MAPFGRNRAVVSGGLLKQLELVMNSKDKENDELRRRVELLEEVLKQHGIGNVVTVDKNTGSLSVQDEKEKERGIEAPLTPHKKAAESTTTDTESDSESTSSLTNEDFWKGKQKTRAVSHNEKSRVVRKVTTICEEDGDEDNRDDDATVGTTTSAATGYTRRSLIMLPEGQRPQEPEPYPQGTSAGGRWYRLTKDQSVDAKPWTNPFSCHCAPVDLDPQVEEYVYYDRLGSRKYFSPTGEAVQNPLQRKGTILKVLPHDGTILAYYKKMGLPLYHQKKHTGKQKLRFSNLATKEYFEV